MNVLSQTDRQTGTQTNRERQRDTYTEMNRHTEKRRNNREHWANSSVYNV